MSMSACEKVRLASWAHLFMSKKNRKKFTSTSTPSLIINFVITVEWSNNHQNGGEGGRVIILEISSSKTRAARHHPNLYKVHHATHKTVLEH